MYTTLAVGVTSVHQSSWLTMVWSVYFCLNSPSGIEMEVTGSCWYCCTLKADFILG